MFSSWNGLKEKSQSIFDCAGAYRPTCTCTNTNKRRFEGRCNNCVKRLRLCQLTIEWTRSRIISHFRIFVQGSWNTKKKTENTNTEMKAGEKYVTRVYEKSKNKISVQRNASNRWIVSFMILSIFFSSLWNPQCFPFNATRSSVQVERANGAHFSFFFLVRCTWKHLRIYVNTHAVFSTLDDREKNFKLLFSNEIFSPGIMVCWFLSFWIRRRILCI